jgi:peroxiredoxin
MAPSTAATDLVPLMPRQPVPALVLPLAGGGAYDLGAEAPKLMSMVVFYRGLHCMQCRDYITELDAMLGEFDRRGIAAVAVSCDVAERGERTAGEWGLKNLRIAYGADFATARRWGLFLTEGRPRAEGLSEPPFYCEPGLFLVNPDGTLFFSAVQNMPFARPRFADLIAGFEFMFERGYFITRDCPARGEVLTLAQTRG